MGTYQHAVQTQVNPVDGAMSLLSATILNCAKEYISRQDRSSWELLITPSDSAWLRNTRAAMTFASLHAGFRFPK